MNTVSFLTIPAGIVPEQEALVFDGLRVTYADLEARVRRLAGALAGLGVGRGTRVAALHTNSHRYVEAYYATAMVAGESHFYISSRLVKEVASLGGDVRGLLPDHILQRLLARAKERQP